MKREGKERKGIGGATNNTERIILSKEKLGDSGNNVHTVQKVQKVRKKERKEERRKEVMAVWNMECGI